MPGIFRVQYCLIGILYWQFFGVDVSVHMVFLLPENCGGFLEEHFVELFKFVL